MDMRNAVESERFIPRPLLVAAAASAVLIAGAGLMLSPRVAEATPQFAQQTGRACGVCHVNPAGGGKLKPAGEKFKASRK